MCQKSSGIKPPISTKPIFKTRCKAADRQMMVSTIAAGMQRESGAIDIAKEVMKRLDGKCKHHESMPYVPFAPTVDSECVQYSCGDRSGFFYWSR